MENFKSTYVDCPSKARIFAYYRTSTGETRRPLLLLLHGYPQNSLMYKHFVEEIPGKWRVLVADLPGYATLFYLTDWRSLTVHGANSDTGTARSLYLTIPEHTQNENGRKTLWS